MESMPSTDYSASGSVPSHSSFTFQSQTLSSNLTHNQSLQFLFPKTSSFYDPASFFLKVEGKVRDEDGNKLTAESACFLKAESVAGLFERVSLYLNGEVATSEPYNHHVSHLYSLISQGEKLRDDVLSAVRYGNVIREVESAHIPTLGPGYFDSEQEDAKGDSSIFLCGKVSPFLSSASNLIPSGTEICLRLDRCGDREVIGSTREGEKGSLLLIKVTAFIKCWNLTSEALSRVERQLSAGGLMSFHRLALTVRSIPAQSPSFIFSNVFRSSPLPDCVFIAFAQERAFLGSHNHLSTFYGGFPVKELSFLVNDLPCGLFRELKCNFTRTETGLLELPTAKTCPDLYYNFLLASGFAQTGLHDVTMSYKKFSLGNTLFCLSIPTSRAKDTVSDALDVRVEFTAPLAEPYVCLVFALQSSHIVASASRVFRPV